MSCALCIERHNVLDQIAITPTEPHPSEMTNAGADIASIDLEGTMLPPTGKLYQLSADELRSFRDFIDENLKKGYIRPSKAPCGEQCL
ncbi:hypothetical protein B0H13DRAFT_2316262 [Mycena leptocephala]|nr:hypothetical protein B0H13DRAFT_2316262 [Mycena leptocephala]